MLNTNISPKYSQITTRVIYLLLGVVVGMYGTLLLLSAAA